ncbi:hypothetical protein WMY93_005636 [Mugilogobius chulae]|uniref:Superoxide dismutase [Cu-Zn] n=1 Tax=Mugilogobius chulae TaxID=88201 RepID=A0AAW0PK56_9GOBI
MHAIWQIFSLAIIQFSLLDHEHCISAHNAVVHPPEASEYNGTLYAGKLSVNLQLHGFDRETAEAKAVHIHQFGDLSSSCASTGGHYNPHGMNHPQHPGDFGNFMTQNGRIRATIESEATLFGGHSVIGRAVVVHQHQDDLGQGGDASSLQNGNAGPRVGCCVIGITSAGLWAKHVNKP